MSDTPSKTPRLAKTRIAEPTGLLERINAAFLRGVLRTCLRTFIGPPFGVGAQRLVVGLLVLLMPGRGGASRRPTETRGVRTEVVTPKRGGAGGAVLYIHGGAFCLGGAFSHRSITTHLVVSSGMPVHVQEYRLPQSIRITSVSRRRREVTAYKKITGEDWKTYQATPQGPVTIECRRCIQRPSGI